MSKPEYTNKVISKKISNKEDENYQWKVQLIYLDLISIQAISINTGAVYKLNLEKNKEWCKKILINFQNDFSQLYHIIDEALFNKNESFSYTVNNKDDRLQLIVKTNPDVKFFKFEIEIDIPRFISEDGLISDRLNCVEYQLNYFKKNFNTKQVKCGDLIKIYNECGNLVYYGEMKNGKRNGQGKEYCSNSGELIYEGKFKGGYYETLYNSDNNQAILDD